MDMELRTPNKWEVFNPDNESQREVLMACARIIGTVSTGYSFVQRLWDWEVVFQKIEAATYINLDRDNDDPDLDFIKQEVRHARKQVMI